MTHSPLPTVPHALDGCISFPDEAAYEEATRIFSVSRSTRPALVAHCANPGQVAAAIAFARENGLRLSVKGGGHDWAGRALCDGLTIDLAGMRGVAIAADRRSAWIGGGCRIDDVLPVLDPLGLVAVTGSAGAVGMAGLTLGGGYGPLIGRFGLALDNLLGVEIVLADGRALRVDAEHEPDLFWALRGGGGNFGVVTRLHIALHGLASIHGGMVTYPLAEAREVLNGAVARLEDAPDALTAQLGLVPGPAGEHVAMVAPFWCGDPDEGERRVAPFAALGTPASIAVGASSFGGSTKIWDAHCVTGARAFMANRWLPRLDGDGIDVWLEAVERAKGAARAVFTHEFRGAAARVAPAATAFGMRDPHVVVEILGLSNGPDDDEASAAWVEALSAALGPTAVPGGYANLLAPEQADQVAQAFGANAGRLCEIKTRYDPSNVFWSALPLPPS